VLNEPNCYVTGDEYLRILQTTSRILRAEDPAATIIGGSVVNAPRQELYQKTMTQGAPYFDLFSYHPYRFGLRNPESENESFRRGLLMAKEDLAKAGAKTPIFLTEEGGDFGPKMADWGSEERLEAQYTARMYLTALGEGCAGYSYHVLHTLVRDDNMTPMLGLSAIHTMANLLGDATLQGRLEAEPDYVEYLFATGDQSSIVAIWAKDAEYAQPQAVTLKTATLLRTVNHLGNPVANVPTNDGQQIMLGRDPIYLIFPQLAHEEAKRVVEAAMSSIHSIPGR